MKYFFIINKKIRLNFNFINSINLILIIFFLINCKKEKKNLEANNLNFPIEIKNINIKDIKQSYFVCSNEKFNNISLGVAKIKLLIKVYDSILLILEKDLYKNTDIKKSKRDKVLKNLWLMYNSIKGTKKKLEIIENKVNKLYKEINHLYKSEKLKSIKKPYRILKEALEDKKEIEEKKILLNYRIFKLVRFIKKLKIKKN